MSKWMLKACPKCGGSLFIEKDDVLSGWYGQCINCAFRVELKPISRADIRLTENKELVGKN